MIRLGSLAGYTFEGPRVLGGFAPPPIPAVYAIAYKPDPEVKAEKYAIIYVDHADDMTQAKLPFKHPRAGCWIRRAGGDKFGLFICYFEVPGGTRKHREEITEELISIYQPECNPQQYDRAWDDHWIGEYQTSVTTTKGLMTGRNPDDHFRREGDH